MGPRPFGRGRRRAALHAAHAGGASMGPRPFGRGRNGIDPGFGENDKQASMGPRPFGRGRGNSTYMLRFGLMMLQWGRDLSVAEGRCVPGSVITAGGLQWGRDLSVAEGANKQYRPRVPDKLQWGRDLSVAEGGAVGPDVDGVHGASMGPRPFGRGR